MNIIRKLFAGDEKNNKAAPKRHSSSNEALLAQIQKLSVEKDCEAIQLLVEKELHILEAREEEYQKSIKPYNDAAKVAYEKMEEILEQNFKADCTISSYRHFHGGGTLLTIPKEPTKNDFRINFELSFNIDSLKSDQTKEEKD